MDQRNGTDIPVGRRVTWWGGLRWEGNAPVSRGLVQTRQPRAEDHSNQLPLWTETHHYSMGLFPHLHRPSVGAALLIKPIWYQDQVLLSLCRASSDSSCGLTSCCQDTTAWSPDLLIQDPCLVGAWTLPCTWTSPRSVHDPGLHHIPTGLLPLWSTHSPGSSWAATKNEEGTGCRQARR